MRIVVPVKQVGELHDGFRIVDGRVVDPDFVELVLNEWDTYAIGAATQLAATLGGAEIIAVCVDSEDPSAVLRSAVALGANSAVHIALGDDLAVDTLLVGRMVAAFVADVGADLVLCGVQSADAGSGATPAAIAGALLWPRLSAVVGIDIGAGAARVDRELGGGAVEQLEVPLPAVLALQSGSYDVAYPTMKARMAAKKAVVDVRDAAGLVPNRHLHDLIGATSLGMSVRQSSSSAVPLEGSPTQVAARIRRIIEEQLA